MYFIDWVDAHITVLRLRFHAWRARRLSVKGLAISEKLLASDPSNPQFQEMVKRGKQLAGEMRTTRAAVNIARDQLRDL